MIKTSKVFFFSSAKHNLITSLFEQIDRVIPVAGKEELTSFHHLFWTKTQKNMTDGHIWFSVFNRPPRSRFTRVQRLTCCLALLFSSMMANILFYQSADVTTSDPNNRVITTLHSDFREILNFMLFCFRFKFIAWDPSTSPCRWFTLVS